MAEVFAKSITFPGLDNTYLFETILNSDHDAENLIKENDDLNNYTTPGRYKCSGGNVAATIGNSPITGSGYILLVIQGYVNGRVWQIMLGNSNTLFIRAISGSDWESWFSFGDQIIATNYNYGSTLPTSNLNEGRIFFKT